MEKNIFIKALLIISGTIGIWIGYSLLFSPIEFEASAGINIGEDVNLLSEIRAPGGLLLVSGILIFLGVIYSKMTIYSIKLACLTYLSYGFSRLISIVFDGFPSEPLLIALFVELLIGFTCLYVLIRMYKKDDKLNLQ